MISIAIIPARGGSKRIPKKNIKLFCDKPIIAYSIEAAIASGLFERVIVSTDSAAIAEVARAYGAETPFIRPDELSGDYTGTNEVVAHAIKTLQQEGVELGHVCCIYATAPFIQNIYLQQGLDSLIASKNKHYAFSVTQYNYPVQRSFTINAEQQTLQLKEPEAISARSQDLAKFYHDAGQFYWALAEDFINIRDKGFFSSFSEPIILPSYLVQDIDDEEDWYRAEAMYRALTELKLLAQSEI